MNSDWNVRSEISILLQRWPLVFLLFLSGGLLGWSFGWLLPAPYRAEFEMYVAYTGDRIYRNPDDYKNWQLSELEIFIYSDDMLQTALERLRQQDPYWEDISISTVRPGLHTYWRNAGKWRLVAEWDQPERAAQIASAWGAAVVEKTQAAVEQGRLGLMLSDRIHALAKDEAQLAQHSAYLAESAKAIEAWKTAASQAPAGQPLPVLERWRLQTLAAGLADLNPSAVALLGQFPPAGASAQDAIPWAEFAGQAFLDEHSLLLGQEADLAQRRELLTREWEAASIASRNLTSDLYVEQIADITPEGKPIRMSAQLSLVGGGLALLAGGFFSMAGIRRKAQS